MAAEMRPNRPAAMALVCSSGGHLAQLLALKPFWVGRDRFWVTFDTEDAVSQLAGERTYWCFHPTNRNAVNLIRNFVLAARVLVRERPRMIVSTGAAVAVPFLYLGRMLGARTVFIEVVDRVDGPTLTGRLVRRIATRVLVQWPEQLKYYPDAELVGPLL